MKARAAVVVVVATSAVAPAADAQPRPGYEVRIPDRVELVAGTPGQLGVSIEVDRDLVISRDAAVIVDLAPDPAVIIRKRRLGRNDAVDPEAASPRFAIDVRADAAGDARPDVEVGVRVRFWLCNRRTCRQVDVRRKVAVAIAVAIGSGSAGSGR